MLLSMFKASKESIGRQTGFIEMPSKEERIYQQHLDDLGGEKNVFHVVDVGEALKLI